MFLFYFREGRTQCDENGHDNRDPEDSLSTQHDDLVHKIYALKERIDHNPQERQDGRARDNDPGDYGPATTKSVTQINEHGKKSNSLMRVESNIHVRRPDGRNRHSRTKVGQTLDGTTVPRHNGA